MGKVTVLQAKVNEEPEVKVIENNIDEMQKIVGGWIETVRISKDIIMVVNEEGMLQELPFNFFTMVSTSDGNSVKPVDEILGDVFFVSIAGEDFSSLDKVQIKMIKKMFSYTRQALFLG